MSSPVAETDSQTLLCRFVTGELPLFAFEAWLADEAPPPLRAQLQGLPRAEQEAAARNILPPGRLVRFELENCLPWILADEARATRAVALCAQLQAEGHAALGPIAGALNEGWLDPDHRQFDWERVKAVIPAVQPAAELLLELLASGDYRPDGSALLPPFHNLLLQPDWRQANQDITAWRAHLTPAEQPVGPDGPAAWLPEALNALEAGRLDQAEALAGSYLPQAEAARLLATIRLRRQQPAEALAYLWTAFQAGAEAGLLLEIGRLAHALGHFTEAADAFSRARHHGLRLDDTDCHRCAQALYETGAAAEALGLYAQLLNTYPDHASLWMDFGNAALSQGQTEVALGAFERSLALRPGHPLTLYSLARARYLTGQPEVETLLDEALQAQPDLGPADSLKARLLQERGEYAAAAERLEMRLRQQPSAALWTQYGSCLQARRQGPGAAAAYAEALRLEPNHADALRQSGELLRERNAPEQARHLFATGFDRHPEWRYLEAFTLPIVAADAEALARECQGFAARLTALEAAPIALQDPQQQLGRLPFYAAYLGLDDRDWQTRVARLLLQATPELGWEAPHCRRPRRPGPWRIGLISAFIHSHTVWHLLGHLPAGLRAAEVAFSLIHSGSYRDAVTAAQARQDGWLQLPRHLPAAREALAARELDLLLYLDVGMDPFTTWLAQARLAPIQAATLGHPLTSGIPQIDVFLSSTGLETVGQPHYSESLVQLPELFFHWQPPAMPHTSAEAFGLPAGRRYLCPQSLYKLHPEMDDLFENLLAEDAQAQLVLLEGLYPEWRQALEARWQGRLDPQRVHWLPRLSQAEFWQLLGCGQVMLDTRPFGGGLSLAQALSQGLPFVTWPTDRLKGRVGAGLASQLEWGDAVAENPQEYVSKAVALAQRESPVEREALRRRYAEAMQAANGAKAVAMKLVELCERRFSE